MDYSTRGTRGRLEETTALPLLVVALYRMVKQEVERRVPLQSVTSHVNLHL
jgi:hypothetical protein